MSFVPVKSYGVLDQDKPESLLDEVAEQVRRIGYSVLESGYTADELADISEAFNRTRAKYV